MLTLQWCTEHAKMIPLRRALEVIMEAFSFPPEFRTTNVPTNGTSIYVRTGGAGPTVVLLHGYGETGDMWAPLAVDLARDHTVVVPDLRGILRTGAFGQHCGLRGQPRQSRALGR